MEELDYIIVGQGIAGSCLAWELCQQGTKVLIFDDNYKSSSTLISAGLMNPITGMRLVKSWEVEQFLEPAKTYYRELEKHLGVTLFQERENLRFFKNDLEIKQWEKRKLDSSYNDYLGERFKPGVWGKAIEDLYGSFIIKGGGSLNTQVFLNVMKNYFKEQGIIKQCKLDYEAVQLSKEDVYYKGLKAKKIIFCEGYKVKENPWFGHLKWIPAKGEILTIKVNQTLPDKVIHKEKWLLPMDKGYYKVGSTYDWDHLDSVCTQAGRNEILKGLKEILKVDNIEIISHSAGVRPCTKDTKPYVGLHKEHQSLGILNGLGSKGAMMAPYYARAMATSLTTGKTIALDRD